MAEEKYVSLKDAAEMLGCSVTTIRRYVADGKLKAFTRPGRGNVFFVERAAVEKMLTFNVVDRRKRKKVPVLQ